jgi:uncharacterized protein YbgA (DUF1722 family)/uncharacterized protein YbbK (DUF523 family)
VKPRVGVSACLLGEPVRYDGGHKRDDFIADRLSAFVDYVPVCPEMELGLGTPRPTLRLERRGSATRLVFAKSRQDITDGMSAWSRARVDALAAQNLSGYIFKKGSPSCGLERVKVVTDKGGPAPSEQGVFARIWSRATPGLAAEEEGRLNDRGLRHHFLVRLFAAARWQELLSAKPRLKDLVEFHARHKFLLQTHGEAALRQLGPLVANAKKAAWPGVLKKYEEGFFAGLARPASAGATVNALQHMFGYFSDRLEPSEKEEFLALTREFKTGHAPISALLTLLRHYVSKYKVSYLAGQHFLEPYPKKLLRYDGSI